MSQPKKKTKPLKKSSKKPEEDKNNVKEQTTKPKTIEVKSAPELPVETETKPTKTKIKVVDHTETEQKNNNEIDGQETEITPEKTKIEDTKRDDIEVDNSDNIGPNDNDGEPEEIVESKSSSETVILNKDNQDIEVKPLKELESKNISNAVDDIVAQESDDALKAEVGEGPSDTSLTQVTKKPKSIRRKRHPLKYFVVFTLLIFVAASIYPKSRYFMLEKIGIKSTVSVSVIDATTNTPVNNAQVNIGNVSTKTDNHGVATLSKTNIGPTKMVINKPAYESYNQDLAIGFGNNKLTEIRMNPIGQQYSFVIKDYLSDKPIESVEASSNEFSAMSDSNGRIKLPIDINGKENFSVKFIKEDYRIDEYELPTTTNTETNYQLVASRKHVYLSKDEDRYNVYSVDLDGKNKKLVLKGTGNEGDGLKMFNNPLSNVFAMTSHRKSQKNASGDLLTNLTVVDYGVGKVYEPVTSDNLQIIGWIGSDLVYVHETEDSKADSPDRHKLVSYDFKNDTQKEIAAANYFNDIKIAGQDIYFAKSSQNIPEKVGLVKSSSDGTDKKTLIDSEVSKIYRQDYENLVASSYGKWLNIDMSNDKVSILTAKPTELSSKIFVDSPNQRTALIIKKQNSIDQLLNYLPSSKEEQLIANINGSSYPLSWLNKTYVVFRVKDESGYYDYVVNVDGGEPRRLSEVFPEQSVDEWYHY